MAKLPHRLDFFGIPVKHHVFRGGRIGEATQLGHSDADEERGKGQREEHDDDTRVELGHDEEHEPDGGQKADGDYGRLDGQQARRSGAEPNAAVESTCENLPEDLKF